jgi:cysteinyl-tRNA synthetase
MDWTAEKAQIARNHLKRWWQLVGPAEYQDVSESVPSEVLDAVANDLDSAGALAALMKLENEGRFEELLAGARFLGLLCSEKDRVRLLVAPNLSEAIRSKIGQVVVSWVEARSKKDWKMADEISRAMKDVGIQLIALRDDGSDWKHIDPDSIDDAKQLALDHRLNELLSTLK